MDAIYVLGAFGAWAVTWALAVACDRLRKRAAT